MPKITEHQGASQHPLDVPSAVPSEDEYTAAMERHGTADWTEDDRRVQERYLAARAGNVEEPGRDVSEDTVTVPGDEPAEEAPEDVTVERSELEPVVPDYAEWPDTELKDELKTRKLSTAGKREDWVARLRENDTQEG